MALLPLFVYRLVAGRLLVRGEEALRRVATEEMLQRERLGLSQSADREGRHLEESARSLLGLLRGVSAQVADALEKGPDPALPAEVMSDPGAGPFRGPERAGSAVVVRRKDGLTPSTLRDVASSRRLEEPFARIVNGSSFIASSYVLSASGVMRIVPWSDVSRLVEAGLLAEEFTFPGQYLANAPPETKYMFTAVYDDLYANRGRIVSVLAPVYGRTGNRIAVVGLDWAVEQLLRTSRNAEMDDVTELIMDAEGKLLLALPVGQSSVDPAPAASALARRVVPPGSFDDRIFIAGRECLVSARPMQSPAWTYVRLLPLKAVEKRLLATFAPLTEESDRRRRWLDLGLAFTVVLLAGLLVAVSRAAVLPVRRAARYARKVMRGEALVEPPEARADETGSLVAAVRELDVRVRRRVRTMDGVHDLARTASAMTRPDETYARLSRRIAELVGAEKAWFSLFNAEKRVLEFVAPGFGVPPEALDGLSVGLAEQSLAVLAFRSGELVSSNDLVHDVRKSKTLMSAMAVKRNAVFVPLRTEVGVLGVLVVCDKATDFDAEDLAAIQSYADQAALLLRNARLYLELQKSYERLRDAHRNRDYFLQNVNHELRTPLTAILGWSEVLAEDRPDPGTQKTAVEQIRRSAEFLLTLISDLLDLSRYEEQGTRLSPATVDVGQLVRDAVEPVAVMAEGKGIAITVTAPPLGSTSAKLDPVRMKQVLWNLVHNAVKFTPRHGRIDVDARRDDTGTIFTVSDDGVGIDPKDLPYIFDRFRQGDGSTTRAYRGTGIGLALAKAFVELHGGTISVESNPGRGASFKVWVPS